MFFFCRFCYKSFSCLCGRILDNLPLVVPIERVDQGSPAVVYQLGYHVGLKGQYEGVSMFRLLAVFSNVCEVARFSKLRFFIHRAKSRSSLCTITWHLQSDITEM